jgi:hypothetical protein
VGILKASNLALAFFTELAMLVAFGYGGFQLAGPKWLRYCAAFGLPIVAIALWAWLAAPKSRTQLPMPWLVVFQLTMFTASSALLYRAGRPTLAIVFQVTVMLNVGLAMFWGQR